MLEMGIVVGLGLLVMFWKMSWKWRMRLLSNPLAVDIIIFVALSAMHWGTFSGLMVAAVGALFCSIVLSLGRLMFGHVERGQYIPGVINVRDKL
jgi:hypothetical protein